MSDKPQVKPIFEGHRTIDAGKIRRQIIADTKPTEPNTPKNG